MSEPAKGPGGQRRILWRFAAIVAVFLALGPPVGGLSLWVVSVWRSKSGIMHAFLPILGFSYFVGFFFALVAGVIVAAAGLWWRRNSLLVPVLAAAVASVAVVLTAKLFALPTASIHHETEMIILVYFAISLVAAVVCWFATRKLVRSAWALPS
jgi:hypothetical protein